MTLNFQTTKNLGIQGYNQFFNILENASVKTGFMNLGRRDLNWEDTMGAKLNIIWAAGSDLHSLLGGRVDNARTQAEETWFANRLSEVKDAMDAICLVASTVLDDFSDFEWNGYTESTLEFLTNDLNLDSNSYDYSQVLSRISLEIARDSVVGTLKNSGFRSEADVIDAIAESFSSLITDICAKDDRIANASATRQTVATAPAPANNLQSIFNAL
jgi:hypothetical protein